MGKQAHRYTLAPSAETAIPSAPSPLARPSPSLTLSLPARLPPPPPASCLAVLVRVHQPLQPGVQLDLRSIIIIIIIIIINNNND